MDEKLVNSAIEDVRLIKQVIERTDDSLLSFGKILIAWGLLFLFKLGLFLIIGVNEEFSNRLYSKIPLLFYSIYPLFVLMAIFIYIVYSKGLNIVGLGRQLMCIWLFIFGFNLLLPVITLFLHSLLKINTSIIYTSRPAISFITFALGFFITYIFTKFNLPKWLFAIFLIMGFFALIPGTVSNTALEYVWPMTFLVLGGYFEYKNKKAGGN